MNKDLKGKKKAMADLDQKMAKYGESADLVKRIEQLEAENAELREQLKNGGASEQELKETQSERDELKS